MTATSHALIGTVIAAKIGNPALAVPLALFSHVASDFVPHWDEGVNRREKTKKRLLLETIADILLGFILSYILIVFLFPQTNLFYAFLIIIVSQLPDWLMGPYYFFGWRAFKWAYNFGKLTNSEADKPWGIINQVVLIFLLILLAKNF